MRREGSDPGRKSRFVRLERSDGVFLLVIDRPPANAVDLESLDETEALLDRLEATDDAGAVIITGTGRFFSVGLDLKVVPSYTPEDQRRMIITVNRVIYRLYGLGLPTIAAVNGHAIAGGFVLLATCDYRIGADVDCQVGVTEVRAGIPFPLSTIEVLKAELSHAAARRLILGGRNSGPSEALENGVLDELVPPGELMERALAVAREVGSYPCDGYAKIKRQLRSGALGRIEEVIKSESDPLLDAWIGNEGQGAKERLLGR